MSQCSRVQLLLWLLMFLHVPAIGDEGADSATMMLDKLQQHPQEDLSQITEPATNQRSTYVYPLVLIVGCLLACAWRRSTLSKLLSNRRRVNVSRSRYEV